MKYPSSSILHGHLYYYGMEDEMMMDDRVEVYL